jgi:hypothetical protein
MPGNDRSREPMISEAATPTVSRWAGGRRLRPPRHTGQGSGWSFGSRGRSYRRPPPISTSRLVRQSAHNLRYVKFEPVPPGAADGFTTRRNAGISEQCRASRFGSRVCTV